MFRHIILVGCVATASAFSTSSAGLGLRAQSSRAVAPRHAARTSSSLKMQNLQAQVPVDIFEDMDGEGQEVKTSPFLKEAEVKHGRLAMLAAVGWPAAELLHPFLAQAAGLPSLLTETGQVPSVLNGGLEKLLDAPFSIFFLIYFLGNAFSTEMDSLKPRNNFLNKTPKDMYPHDMGFDPLGFYKDLAEPERKIMAEKELNNGRLAMIAIALYPAIEFASKLPLVKLEPIYAN